MYFSEQGNVDDDTTLITIFLVSFNLQSCCLMQSAVCGLQSAVCSLQYANVIHRVFWEFGFSRKHEKSDSWELEIGREIVRLTTKSWDLTSLWLSISSPGLFLESGESLNTILKNNNSLQAVDCLNNSGVFLAYLAVSGRFQPVLVLSLFLYINIYEEQS